MRLEYARIIVIIALYLGLASSYSVITPLGEGPDEPGHAKYVFFLAREGRLPLQCAPPCSGEVPGEGHQPPLAYALMAPALLWMPREERSFDLPGNRYFVWAGGQELNAAGHGSREFWPWHGEVLAWHLARLINVLPGALSILFTYMAARVAVKELALASQAAWLAALLVALNPQFLFTSGLINNDTLLTMLCALALWLMLRSWELRDHERTRAAGNISSFRNSQDSHGSTQHSTLGRSFVIPHAPVLGLVLGLALLTKQSAVVLIPIAMLSGMLCFENGRWAVAKGLLRVAAIMVVAGLVAGWWYLRNWQLYGDPLGLSVFLAEFRTQSFDARSLAAWRDGLLLLHESFWARFGWMNVPVPASVIWFYGIIELLGLLGLIMLIHRLTMGTKRGSTSGTGFVPMIILFGFPLLSFAWVVSFALNTGLVAWQGRLIFPALPAIAILLGLGWQEVWGKGSTLNIQAGIQHVGKSTPASIICIAVVMLLLAAWLPFGVIQAAYPPQTLAEQAALSRIAQPVDVRFAARRDERGAELRSIKIDGLAHPGATITTTLLWHALGRQNRDWWVFVHLVDAQEHILAETNGEPRQAAFRMSLWSAGDWIEDQHTLALPTNLPPGSYRLRVGLWDVVTQQRAGVFNSSNKLVGDFVDLGEVVIR